MTASESLPRLRGGCDATHLPEGSFRLGEVFIGTGACSVSHEFVTPCRSKSVRRVGSPVALRNASSRAEFLAPSLRYPSSACRTLFSRLKSKRKEKAGATNRRSLF